MHTTIFDTPVLAPVMRLFAVTLLKLAGWKVKGNAPTVQQYVMVAAPHTSNWDMFWLLIVAFHFRLKVTWIGKESLFKGWRGPIMTWLGGLAIQRTGKLGEVERIADFIRSNDRAGIIMAPEGTRGQVKKWKTGFYHIAIAANVPIMPTFLDFGKSETGIGPLFLPTGDIDADLPQIQEFYKGMKGKNKTFDDSIKNTPAGDA